jgi:membrane protease YdiL (CAAX protease family)
MAAPPDAAASIQASPGETPGPPRGLLLAEIAVVLCLAVVPHLANALLRADGGTNLPLSTDLALLAVVSLQVAAPLLWILHRSGEPWSRFGIVKPGALVDVVTSFVLFAALYAVPPQVMSLATTLFPELEASGADFYRAPGSGVEYVLLFPALLLSAFAEELALRAYLIPRLSQLGFRKVSAVLVSSALFASYHAYQGSYAVVYIFVYGLVLGSFFLLVPRLWPLTITHALWNVVGYLGAGS